MLSKRYESTGVKRRNKEMTQISHNKISQLSHCSIERYNSETAIFESRSGNSIRRVTFQMFQF